MTRNPPATLSVHLPPRPWLLTAALRHAPELATLAVLDDALRAALLALVSVHPSLQDFTRPYEPPSLQHARRLVSAALNLRQILDLYRHAVHDAIGLFDIPPDDLPF